MADRVTSLRLGFVSMTRSFVGVNAFCAIYVGYTSCPLLILYVSLLRLLRPWSSSASMCSVCVVRIVFHLIFPFVFVSNFVAPILLVGEIDMLAYPIH